jgi:alkylhydroperoxidase/carboxymuconolactone decarboxylase family protein YurZ
LMQLAIYSGVPAANTAFGLAQKLLNERGAKQ